MIMKKLTPRQLEVLKLLALPGNRAIYHLLGHWYIIKNDSVKKCTRQINFLIDHSFIRSVKWLGDWTATTSTEGEKYLEKILSIEAKGEKYLEENLLSKEGVQ